MMSARYGALMAASLLGVIVLVGQVIAQPAGDGGCPCERPPERHDVEIIRVYPHDPTAFTQGLVFWEGRLYEGTGRRGQTRLREVTLQTGRSIREVRLPHPFFGEGIAIHGDRIIQLTWKSGIGMVYQLRTFRIVQRFRYKGEGWGITHDGTRFIVSDGSSSLAFWDLETYREIGRVAVRDGCHPVRWLNELEYVRGEVWANVWRTDRIARIDPVTGCVVGWIDLRGLRADHVPDGVNVLNGIAYDDHADRLFVTGKLWPELFEIRLTGPSGSPAEAPVQQSRKRRSTAATSSGVKGLAR